MIVNWGWIVFIILQIAFWYSGGILKIVWVMDVGWAVEVGRGKRDLG